MVSNHDSGAMRQSNQIRVTIDIATDLQIAHASFEKIGRIAAIQGMRISPVDGVNAKGTLSEPPGPSGADAWTEFCQIDEFHSTCDV